MHIPTLEGKCDQTGLFVFTACDTHYFEEFGRTIVRSIQKNTQMGIHLHLYSPSQSQLDWCHGQPQVSVTHEHVTRDMFAPAAAQWQGELDQVRADQLRRTQTAMQKGGDRDLVDRMQKTYYACARFVRLQQIISSNSTVLAIDSDAVVRSNIPLLPPGPDLYIHYISGRKARYLAGGLWLPGGEPGYRFMTEYAALLTQHIQQDQLYWGLDQDLLCQVVPRYQSAQLPASYIDWEMRDHSPVWTAKGQRKELEIFVNEQKKYSL